MMKIPFLSALFFYFCWQPVAIADKLIFAEEFSYEGQPDPSIWSYDIGVGNWGWGNAELQSYTNSEDNVRVNQRRLIITAQRQGDSFTSARIKTLNKVTFRYGRMEASIKMPNLGNGLWPAFWTLGNNFPIVGWPACGEIDIMEMGHSSGISEGKINRKVGSAAHWEHGELGRATYGLFWDAKQDLSQAFHKYSLEWTPTMLRTLIDDNLVWEMDISEEKCGEQCSEFHEHHFFLLNLAVGGQYTGLLSANQITAPFPAQYEVDYIRLYANEWTQVGGSYFSDEPTHHLTDCGCPTTCTASILNRSSTSPEGTFTCRERIDWTISNLQYHQEDACSVVSKEFPNICGAGCDPSKCSAVYPTTAPTSPPTPPPTLSPTLRAGSKVDCGCAGICEAETLDQMADGFTCRSRIHWLMDRYNKQEEEACSMVSKEFPEVCGQKCNPFTCDLGRDIGDKITKREVSCGCSDCDASTLGRMADGYSCRDRIEWLIDTDSNTEEEACFSVSNQFPNICGQCNPATCSRNCFCPGNCDDSILDQQVTDIGGTYSCRDRIQWIMGTENVSHESACILVSEEFPSVCGQGCHSNSCNHSPTPVVVDCGCPACSDQTLNQVAAGHSCRDRINWVMEYYVSILHIDTLSKILYF
jgi:beta-glucanase (GH16 family)